MKNQQNVSSDILKSTSIIGGSKIFTILLQVVQGKVVALLLGPIGVGLTSLYSSVTTLVSSITNMGIDFSAVRDVSEAAASGDNDRIAKTIITLRRWVWCSGLLGVLITVIFSKQLSKYTFGDNQHSVEIILLSSTILFGAISAGQMAIIQGYRKIAALAKANIYGSLIGFCVTLPIYFYFGVKGIIPVLILLSLFNLILSQQFAKQITINAIPVSFSESFYGGLSMVKLGFFKMITGFIAAGTLYLVRKVLADKEGVDAVGFFAAASALAITYMAIVFDAMSADYYPRLSAINKDLPAVNRLVNDQTYVTLLLGMPLMSGMLLFGDFILVTLYSSAFASASLMLNWMLLAIFPRLISFPLGYVFVSMAKGKIFIFTQTLWNSIFFIAFLYARDIWGVEAPGIGFLVASVVGYFVNLLILVKISGFKYESKLLYLILFFFVTSVLSFCLSKYLLGMYKHAGLSIIFIVVSFISIKQLQHVSGFHLFEKLKQRFKQNN